MAKIQRRFKVGAAYTVQGAAKLKRALKFVGQVKVNGKETLLFQAKRKASKQKP